MIDLDQPNCFPGGLLVALSSRDNGTMADRRLQLDDEQVVQNQKSFCADNGVSYENTVYQKIIYSDKAVYNLIAEVNSRSTIKHSDAMLADALITKQCDIGLFLPLADCIGLVLFDPVLRILAVAHMGRHSTLTDLIERVVARFKSYGSDVHDIIAYMTPSAGKNSYRMQYFDQRYDSAWRPYVQVCDDGIYVDLAGYNRERLQETGLLDQNIHISDIDTVKSDDYFSHSAGDTSARFAVLAMMR